MYDLHDAVKYLWARPDVRLPEHAGADALGIAAQMGYPVVLRLLLSPPSPLTANSRDSKDLLPLHRAVFSAQSLEAVLVLLENGASCTLRSTSSMRCALHYAFTKGDREATRVSMVRALLAAPEGMSAIDCVDLDGSTPLHRAATNGLARCCEELIRHSQASIESLNYHGNSP